MIFRLGELFCGPGGLGYAASTATCPPENGIYGIKPTNDANGLPVPNGDRRTGENARISLALFGLVGLLAVIFWVVPDLQIPHSIHDPAKREEIENNCRSTLATIVGGCLLLFTSYYAWRTVAATEATVIASYRTLNLAREGQITDRFAKAVEQLGGKSVPIRLGGLYSLERLANDSAQDYWTVMEVICGFVRDSVPRTTSNPVCSIEVANDSLDLGQPDTKLRTDIQTAITILGRCRTSQRSDSGETRQLDLSDIDLRGADLSDLDFRRTVFGSTDFSYAIIRRTNFGDARFAGVLIARSNLDTCNFQNAYFFASTLMQLQFDNCSFNDAQLINSSIKTCRIADCNLGNAKLDNPILVDVSFCGCQLNHVVFDRPTIRDCEFDEHCTCTDSARFNDVYKIGELQLPDKSHVTFLPSGGEPGDC